MEYLWYERSHTGAWEREKRGEFGETSSIAEENTQHLQIEHFQH